MFAWISLAALSQIIVLESKAVIYRPPISSCIVLSDLVCNI